MHIIRRLNPGEASLYRQIRLEALEKSPDAFATSYASALRRDDASWTQQADASAYGKDRATFLVFAERPIGTAALYRDSNDPSSGELIQMWIAESHRGSSVATDLLDHLFAWAARHDFATIHAEVTPGNSRAIRFYEKYGFRQIPSHGESTLLTKAVP